MLDCFLFVKNGDKFSFLVLSLPSHLSSSELLSDKNAEVRADTEELGPVEEDSTTAELHSNSTFEVDMGIKTFVQKRRTTYPGSLCVQRGDITSNKVIRSPLLFQLSSLLYLLQFYSITLCYLAFQYHV